MYGKEKKNLNKKYEPSFRIQIIHLCLIRQQSAMQSAPMDVILDINAKSFYTYKCSWTGSTTGPSPERQCNGQQQKHTKAVRVLLVHTTG